MSEDLSIPKSIRLPAPERDEAIATALRIQSRPERPERRSTPAFATQPAAPPAPVDAAEGKVPARGAGAQAWQQGADLALQAWAERLAVQAMTLRRKEEALLVRERVAEARERRTQIRAETLWQEQLRVQRYWRACKRAGKILSFRAVVLLGVLFGVGLVSLWILEALPR